MNIKKIQKELAVFAEERDWVGYHTPKNLVSALSVETAELLEIFQWKRDGGLDEMSDAEMRMVGEEMADVAIYLLRLADVGGVDIEKEVLNKIVKNKEKYSVEDSKGEFKKYNRRD